MEANSFQSSAYPLKLYNYSIVKWIFLTIWQQNFKAYLKSWRWKQVSPRALLAPHCCSDLVKQIFESTKIFWVNVGLAVMPRSWWGAGSWQNVEAYSQNWRLMQFSPWALIAPHWCSDLLKQIFEPIQIFWINVGLAIMPRDWWGASSWQNVETYSQNWRWKQFSPRALLALNSKTDFWTNSNLLD